MTLLSVVARGLVPRQTAFYKALALRKFDLKDTTFYGKIFNNKTENHKHIVNEHKREHINSVCQEVGFQLTTLCTPMELIEEIQMKETPEKQPEFDPETYTNPILEECYRIKAEISAQFNSMDELYAYFKAIQEEDKRNGVKYVSYFDPAKYTLPEKSGDND